MCYHGSKVYDITDLEEYYAFQGAKHAFDKWQRSYHVNGYDHDYSPILIGNTLENFSWGLVPWHTKSAEEAMKIRNKTLNCISEEMWEKPSFRDSVREGKRCLIPFTGFFEWEWLDANGKAKQPYHIFLKGQKIFSVAGLYSTWHNKQNDQYILTYTVLTTKANKLMEKIHNNKKRMPVIIPQELEKKWLSENLSKDDVNGLCQPLDTNLMDAYPISKLITSRTEPTNVPQVLKKIEIQPTTLFG